MGRTRLAKAVVSSLQKEKELSQQRRNQLVNYLKKLNEEHAKDKISGAQYAEAVNKKRNGRNLQ